MADKLLLDVLEGNISIGFLEKWISGQADESCCYCINRSEFALFILNFIQEETSRFVLPDISHANLQRTRNYNNLHDIESKSSSHLDKKTLPGESTKETFSRFEHSGDTATSQVLPVSSNHEWQHITTSTPEQKNPNNRKSENLPLSPVNFSENSFQICTPHSSMSSITTSSGSSTCSSMSQISTPNPKPSQNIEQFPVLTSKNRQRMPLSPCLADFIVKKPISKKIKKRIKPTQLSNIDKDQGGRSNDSLFGSINRPFQVLTSSPLQSEKKTENKKNFDEERNMLKQKRAEILASNVSSQCAIQIIPRHSHKEESKVKKGLCFANSETSKQMFSSTPTIAVVDPDPRLITCMDHISKLAEVYSACLNNNLVPNITSELHLIFTLLTNCYQVKRDSLCILDKESATGGMCSEGTINDQSNLKHFQSLDKRSDMDNIISHNNLPCLTKKEISNIVFHSIHDCVMFASIVIEKQFDLIQCLDKKIIKMLMENSRLSLFVPHLVPSLATIYKYKDSSDSISASFKITLENVPVIYHNDLDNRVNFPSLSAFNIFKKQRDGFYEILHEWRSKNHGNIWVSKTFPFKVQSLIGLSIDPINMMHLARLFCDQLMSSEDDHIESDIKTPSVDKDKMTRLEARFCKPQDMSVSFRPNLQFPGEQHFYQQFLMIAATSSSVFLTHVVDCILHKLNLLDNNKFFEDSMSVEESKSHLKSCVQKCCLIAKFLGLIVFAPYRSNIHSQPQPDILQAQIIVRQQVLPPFNILGYLQRALKSNRLIVTVPWIITFLGMMDPVSPHLPSFRQVMQLLVSIYCALPLPYSSPLTSLFLRITLGWLFDVSFFPEDFFYSLISSCSPIERSVEPKDVDVRNIVDQCLINEVCPYFDNFRLLLSTSGNIKRGTARHITPIPAQLASTSQQITLQTLELQIEETFLVGQAASFRATLDFVIDRISSLCIKHVCSNILASSKELASAALNKLTNKKNNKKERQDLLMEMCRKTEAQILTVISDHYEPKVEKVLSTLLGLDATDPKIFQTACAICRRRCKERIINWFNSHINLIDMFSKVILPVDSKPSVEPLQKVCTRNFELAEDFLPEDLLIELQEKVSRMIEKREPHTITSEEVLDLIKNTLETLQKSSSLMSNTAQYVFSLILDFSIVLLAFYPEVMNPLIVSELCQLWSSYSSPTGDVLERLLCPRNVLLLCQGGAISAQLSWSHFSNLLVGLIKQRLLTPFQLEAQCVSLFQQDWPPMVFSLIRACLSSAIDEIKHCSLVENEPKIFLMLDWINEMSGDMARESS